MKISIVVPLYHGEKYIQGLIKQVELCAEKLFPKWTVELILSNDSPEKMISESMQSDQIELIVLNTDRNRGIHGARVRGLECAKGDYILFLDQDDKLYPEYLESQIGNIGDNDATVCRIVNEGKLHYNVTNPFEKIVELEYILNYGNGIVSPGQVLIKRSAIPKIWEESILKYNGADDWFLWMCMMSMGKKFSLNEEVLFERVVDGKNTSWNGLEMLRSEEEIVEIISEYKILEPVYINKLHELLRKDFLKYVNTLEKFRDMFFLYDSWMSLERKKEDLETYLIKNGYHRVVVYGLGYIGRQLVERFQNANIRVVAAIDINADYLEADVPICKLEDFNKIADLVIVTVAKDAENIVKDISNKLSVPVIAMPQLLQCWERETKGNE